MLYYSQAINTTPIHAHSALFGVYGCLAIALMLFALREMTPESAWNEKLLNFSFWSINGGLVPMSTNLPQIPYKETICRATNSHGRYKHQSGGHGAFGEVYLDIKPLGRGEGFQYY